MEGSLWKWTNYWNGWQLRWFVLENGILSYYKSSEDVNSGCKGSMKVSTCEIVVHPHDNTRLSIIIPGEQHIYIRATSSQDRQKWLVALGSAKACVTTAHSQLIKAHGEQPVTLRAKKSELRLYCDLLNQQVHQIKESAVREEGPDVDKLTEYSTTLAVTCDTFIKTLDECLKLSEATMQCEMPIVDVRPPMVKRSSHHDMVGRKT